MRFYKSLLKIKWNITKKLMVANITILAIPLILIAVIGFGNIRNKLEIGKLQENGYLLDGQKLDIEHNIEAMSITAQLVVSNKNLMNFIETNRDISNEEYVKYSLDTFYDIQNIQSTNPAINRIKFYIKEDKYIPQIYPYIYHENEMENKKNFNQVITSKGKEYWVANNVEDTNTGINGNYQNVVSLYRSINIPSDNHIGIVEVNMNTKDFFRPVFHNTENNDYQFIAIDKEGTVICNDGYLKDNNISTELIKKKFHESKTNYEKGGFILNDHSKKLMVSYVYIDSIHCYLLKVDSFEAVLKSISTNKNIFIFGTIILLILLSTVIYFINSYILKNLRTIIKELKKMRKGNFDIHLSIVTNDEIGELAYHFSEFSNKINELVSDIIKKETVAKEAELRALQNQIDSHFLYNVLENIKMMAEIEEKYDISDAITALGNMMRYNMKWDNQIVNFKDEIDYIKDYTSLINIRFNNKIQLILDIDDHILTFKILKMSLQPIVENCIKHGLKKKISEENSIGKIYISIYLDGDIIRCEIFDNGVGMTNKELQIIRNNFEIPEINIEEHLKSNNIENYTLKTIHGIGLKNVYERIRLFLGNEYKITIYSKEGEYTKVILKLPIIR
ncbi:sensor histidine kinase [Clostridium lacusfryxellense]|uniref:sensor histidine kinase n=1 Tax=Clostridium lacusfryxellense TaxID=205328 RepID=UPI001C0BE855|nr:sensor histidine kinase [Clostridium lacusfryxellense]MBU3111243.1 histidine kinase [Clostridium lacusfryxellense]